MSLLRRSYFDLDWPNWMMNRNPLDWNEAWNDLVADLGLRVEEFEENGRFVIRAEAPGIDPDKDVELTIDEGMLHLRVHRHKESHDGNGTRFRSEFHYGSFSRNVSLPAGATSDQVKATYKDGILEIRVPMNGEKAKSKRIPIESKH